MKMLCVSYLTTENFTELVRPWASVTDARCEPGVMGKNIFFSPRDVPTNLPSTYHHSGPPGSEEEAASAIC
jgi:hypothetical protein